MPDQQSSRAAWLTPLFVWLVCAYFAWRIFSGGISYLPIWTAWIFLIAAVIAAAVFFRRITTK